MENSALNSIQCFHFLKLCEKTAMPIYEYQCEHCDHQFDTLQKLSDKPLRKCPECGKLKLTKLVSAAGFRLKGGGWYETDFKSGSKKNLAGGDKSGTGSSDSGGKSSGDSASTAKSSDKKSSSNKSSASKSTKGGKKAS